MKVFVRKGCYRSSIAGGLLALLFGGCDAQPVVQLSASLPVRDAGMPTAQSAAGSGSFSDWEVLECQEIDPICGSDNQTYQNSCLAARAGVGVLKRGPC